MKKNERQKQLKEKNYLNQRKMIQEILTQDELMDFITQSLKEKGDINLQVNIGKITKEAKERILNLYGKTVSNIDLSNQGVIHAHKKKSHFLEPDDLLYAVDTINTTLEIKLSEIKNQDCDVIEFDKDIDGNIKYLTEIHHKKNHLLIFNAWRKKARRRHDATPKSPSQITSETNLPQAINLNISHSFLDVNGNHEKMIHMILPMSKT